MTMVICVRCLNGYNLQTAPRKAAKRLKRKEPYCPRCKCKLYFNRTDEGKVYLDFEDQQFTSMED